jgi:hypothetical protein
VLTPALAQAGPDSGSGAAISSSDLGNVKTLLARGDAAAAAGNLVEARRIYDEARSISKTAQVLYRDLSGAFRGLDARIPREMDDKARQMTEAFVDANLRLAALFRRQNQPGVAIPLLVEVVKIMTPTTETGRKAYQQLLELGFATTPYTAPSANSN